MQSILNKYIDLPSPNIKGWSNVKCPICNDYKVRASFNFDNSDVAYHCFNCNHKAKYFNKSHISDDFKIVLKAFNIPDDELQKLSFNSLFHKPFKKDKKQDDNPLIELTLPNHFYKIITNGSDELSNVAIEYLNDRGISSREFYLSNSREKIDKMWYGRLIIPYYRNGKLIFYQGRALYDTNKRYINSSIDNKSVILYNYDEIYKKSSEPLYIVEGFFDAYHLNGIAIVGNELSDAKIKIINESKREKIYIPDKFGNGKAPALKALDNNWNISLPDIGNCKDVNDAVKKYGLLYVKKSIMENVKNGFSGKMLINSQCR
jgi:DNA primase